MRFLKAIFNFLKSRGISRPIMIWLVGFASIIAALEISYIHGLLQKIYESDTTKISLLIGCIFFWQSILCGSQLWSQGQWNNSIKEGETCAESGWLWSDIVLSLGMIGTVIGFMMMLGGFATADFSNVESVQKLITKLSSGMSTSLSTTLVGLISSVLLKLQFFNLDKVVEDKKNSRSVL